MNNPFTSVKRKKKDIKKDICLRSETIKINGTKTLSKMGQIEPLYYGISF